MAKKKNKVEDEEIVNLTGIDKFINDKKKILIGVFAGIILLSAAFLLLKESKKGKEKQAIEAAAEAQKRFSNQEWAMAIDGSENFDGFTAIASNYKGTKLGNLANYYAGISQIKMGNYEDAVASLGRFKAVEDANINALAFGNLADAQIQTSADANALKNYKKASDQKSELYQAHYLLTYGMALLEFGEDRSKDALAAFKKLEKDFPNATETAKALNYIAGLEN